MPSYTDDTKLYNCATCGNNKSIKDGFHHTTKRGEPYHPIHCKDCDGTKRGKATVKLIEDLPNEVWITLFDGKYQFSNFCRIKSFSKHKYRLINPVIANNGYYVAGFRTKDGHIVKTIHRLYAENFIPNPNNYPCINHKNGIKIDNSHKNLEWCTYAYNNQHARETGLMIQPVGEKSANHKLNNNQVMEIFNSTQRRKELAIAFNVSMDCIDDIRSGANWSWLTGKNVSKKRNVV